MRLFKATLLSAACIAAFAGAYRAEAESCWSFTDANQCDTLNITPRSCPNADNQFDCQGGSQIQEAEVHNDQYGVQLSVNELWEVLDTVQTPCQLNWVCKYSSLKFGDPKTCHPQGGVIGTQPLPQDVLQGDCSSWG